MKKPFRVLLVLVALAFLILPSRIAFTQNARSSLEYQSYLAHIGAAATSLRLHDTAAAKRWLANAPDKYRGWEWHYLNGVAEQSILTFTTSAPVNSLAISPDGKSLAITSGDKLVRILSTDKGTELFKKFDESLTPQAVVFSPNGKRLAAAYSRHAVRVWDIASGSELLRLQGKGRGITAIALSPDGKMLASCSWNLNSRREVTGIVEIWNADSGESLQQLNYGTKPLTAIAFSPDGKHLAVGSWESQQSVAIWEVGRWGTAVVLESELNDTYRLYSQSALVPTARKSQPAAKTR